MNVDHGWGEQMREPVSCKGFNKDLSIYIYNSKYICIYYSFNWTGLPKCPASNASQGREAIGDFEFLSQIGQAVESCLQLGGKSLIRQTHSKLLGRTHTPLGRSAGVVLFTRTPTNK